MKEQWIREGFSNYYVVEKKRKITYEKDILLHHIMECLLPCELRLEDETEYYYFETGIYTPWIEKRNEMNLQEFFFDFFTVLEEAEEYLLNLDHLKIDEKLVFIDQQRKPVLCYLPDYEKNIFEQIRELLEESMEHISYENKKKAKFYYEFHSYLVKEKPSILQIKEYLKPTPQMIPKEEVESPPEKEINELDEETLSEKKISPIAIFFMVFSFFLLGASAFFAVKIFIYGFYYQFVLGFLVFAGGFAADVWQMWKFWKQGSIEVPIETEEMKTEYLSMDEQKTVCLMEQPLGKFISKKEGRKDIIIEHDGFIIGSSNEGTDYQLPEIGVSRRHVKIFLENGELTAEDLNSTNGTILNGRRIKKESLESGDVLKIGLEEFEFLADMRYTI